MGITHIEWSTYTFNHVIGCTKVSAGCASCYAEADQDHRRGRVKWGPNGTRVKLSDAGWKEPVKWNRQFSESMQASIASQMLPGDSLPRPSRPRVFCASLADVFEDWSGPIVDHKGNRIMWDDQYNAHARFETHASVRPLTMDDLRADLFRLIDATPNLDWLLLTKRPENIRRMIESFSPTDSVGCPFPMRRDNVWLGTSVENQEQAEKRIPELLKCRDLCAKTFLSCEPLLGPVDLTSVKMPVGRIDSLTGRYQDDHGVPDDSAIDGISLVISGGESGPNARPCNIEWIRSIVSQCQAAGTACFVKQLGKSFWIPNDTITDFNGGDRLIVDESTRMPLQGEPCLVSIAGDSKGGDITEWPTDLQIREMP